ncbi:hypothetical protein J8655_12445 [Dickeya oryzae]|uniref:hypothetical protein n=1 Tax=Dickeya oryzae TaxID=1240404 RepID=UPI001AECDF66|nr:hypothetical protein [Dickeya oryzae]MBP2846287.1 hypothetical protein [Dickeya oryzae]
MFHSHYWEMAAARLSTTSSQANAQDLAHLREQGLDTYRIGRLTHPTHLQREV